MITIITGVPGMGKTALVVSMMMEELERGERPFFVSGIPELQLDHSPVPPIAEWTERRPDPNDPEIVCDYFTFPPNSIIILDEAQRVYRPRAAASKVPPHVAAFETHRHTGVDFWLMTQKPHLLDSNVRELCGRHIHIKNGTFFGRYLYEWPEFTDVKNKANFGDAAKRKYAPPRKTFTLYKSAELHTKQQPRRMHHAFLVLAAAIAFSGYFGLRTYNSMSSRFAETDPTEKATAAASEPLPTFTPTPPNAETPSAALQNATRTLQPPIISHPFSDYTFTIKGVMNARGQDLAYFDITNGSGHKTFVSSLELIDMGYAVRIVNGCTAVLYYQGLEILAACSTPNQQPQPIKPEPPQAVAALGVEN